MEQRKQLENEVTYFTVSSKCSNEELAQIIEDSTGVTVDRQAENPLATLTDEQVSAVVRRFREHLLGRPLIKAEEARELLEIVERVYEYEMDQDEDDRHFHQEEIDEWGQIVAKLRGGAQ